MKTETVLIAAAEQIALGAQVRCAALDAELHQLEQKRLALKAERDSLGFAHQRLLNFSFRAGADYQCPCCWIEHETRSALRSIFGTEDVDVFICNACGRRYDIPL